MSEPMRASHTASDRFSASIFDEVDEAFAAVQHNWRQPLTPTNWAIAASPPVQTHYDMPASLVADRQSYARTASSVSSQSQLSPLCEEALQQPGFDEPGAGWGRASDCATERLYGRQCSHQTAQADIFREGPVVRQHWCQSVDLQRNIFQLGQVPTSDLWTQADYGLMPSVPVSSAGGPNSIYGQAPINLRPSAHPALQHLYSNLHPADYARSMAEPAAELKLEEQGGKQAQKQQQPKSGNPARRRGSCDTATDILSVCHRGQQAGLTGTVSVRAKTGAGAALHPDISRHRHHRRAAAAAASGFKSTARGWGPGDFIPKQRRTAYRRAHSFSWHQSRQVGHFLQKKVHRQLLPAHKLKEQQRPQQQQLAQSSQLPLSSASATSTAQDVQRLPLVTGGSRALQLLSDSTGRQVQLRPQVIGSRQQAQTQSDAAMPPSCHKSCDSNQAQAQPERSVNMQPLNETSCKEVQAERAESGQQVHTVHELKQSRKRKATEDVDSDRVPKKVSIAKRQKASPRQSLPHLPLQSEPLQRRRVLRGSSWQLEDGSSVGDNDIVMAKAPGFKEFWPAKIFKPNGDDKQQLDKVYAKLVNSKEMLVPIIYFGDGTVAYAKLANVRRFAAAKSTAGLKKSLVMAMELAQAALLQQMQQQLT